MVDRQQNIRRIYRKGEGMNIVEDIITKRYKGRIIEPNIGSVVVHKDGGKSTLVKILYGKFYGEFGRISNFWEWLNLETNEIESGYGVFYRKGEEK